MIPLHKLPDGTYITLTNVSTIQPVDCYVSDIPNHLFTHPPRVIIKEFERKTTFTGQDIATWIVEFETYQQAKDYADELAALVNEARQKEQTDFKVFEH